MKTKEITIHQMSPDSIDEGESILIEVEYTEGETVRGGEWDEQVWTPEEVTSIKYENIEISEHITPMFTDEELIASTGELETEMSLETIKELTQ